MAAPAGIRDDSFTDLQKRVQALPQELFDNILSLVFSMGRDRIFLTYGYKPPVQLQINRRLSHQFAESYFGSTIFTLPKVYNDVFKKWFLALSPEHRSMLAQKSIRVGHDCGFQSEGRGRPHNPRNCRARKHSIKLFAEHLNKRKPALSLPGGGVVDFVCSRHGDPPRPATFCER